jgi:hypothetical protein
MLRLRLVNNFRAGFAAFLEMGIRSSGTANWSNNHACSIERQRIIEAHSLNAVIEDSCRTSKGCCGLRFVLDDLDAFLRGDPYQSRDNTNVQLQRAGDSVLIGDVT